MDVLEIFEACEDLYLIGICEPRENHLQILLQEAKTHLDRPQQTIVNGKNLGISYPIAPASNGRFFQLEWRLYIAYLVTNESFATYPYGEQFTGDNLRVFTTSVWLRFVSETTNAQGGYPGPYQQYEIPTLMHVVDVAAQEPPEITILTKADIESGISQVCRVAFPRETV